jgi:hypothetical protein
VRNERETERRRRRREGRDGPNIHVQAEPM